MSEPQAKQDGSMNGEAILSPADVAALVVTTEPYELKDIPVSVLMHFAQAAADLGYARGMESHRQLMLKLNAPEVEKVNNEFARLHALLNGQHGPSTVKD